MNYNRTAWSLQYDFIFIFVDLFQSRMRYIVDNKAKLADRCAYAL